MGEGQRSILDIIAALTGRTTTVPVRGGLVVDYSNDNLPAEDVYNYINQLKVLGYISISHKVSGADFVRMINMTTEGVRASLSSSSSR